MRLFDSHCHLDDDRFDGDRKAALERARLAGVDSLVVPAIKAEWWPRLRKTCATHTGLFAAYGLHPMYISDHEDKDLEALAYWIQRENPVAVGECGLDFYIDDPQREAQLRLFRAQLDLARDAGLPVIIHARRSVEDVINILRFYPGVRGVLHSYSGSEQQAMRLINHGFLMGFGGPVTYPRARRLRSLVAALPLDNLLIETDAPDQPSVAHQGKRSEPAHLPEILQIIADLRGESPETIAAATTANAQRLFCV